MKFSEQWLREWVNPAIDSIALAAQLTDAGLEVDTIEPVAANFNKVVIGEILAVADHPDAERLRVCQVSVGQAEPITIVTNVVTLATSMKVACALVGAQLPDLAIKKSKLRGVESHGMFCGYETLGIGDASQGIVTFPADATIGTNVREYLEFDDCIIDIELTPNRGDCFSLLGLARELAVVNRCAMNEPATAPVDVVGSDTLAISLQATDACPRFVGRIIRNINANATTPLWMVERLRRSGIRAIHPVVDVTNYVMLELGQPMHAYDRDKLTGDIQVRYATKGEALTLLDGQTIALSDDHLVIADQQQAIGLAGIMGGDATAVTNESRHIFLESAYFQPQCILGKGRQYGLHTDSSHRFERGVDPELQVRAMERASELLLAIVGGEIATINHVRSPAAIKQSTPITLRINRLQQLLGCVIEAATIDDILTRLGMQLQATDEGYQVTPPSYRFDINIEADLIEEVARIYGYNNIPRQLPIAECALPNTNNNMQAMVHWRGILQARGYHETMCYSFVDPKLQSLLSEDTGLALKNPISPELSVMRTTLWSGLLQSYLHNAHRQQARVRLFETGLRFVNNNDVLKQIPTLAGLVAGSQLPEQWGVAASNIDFYDAKADVEALLPPTTEAYQFIAQTIQALHPGQSAAIYQQQQFIGWVGRLHPKIQQKLKINDNIYLFELDTERLLELKIPITVQKVSKFPAIRRDIAIVVGLQVNTADILGAIRRVAGNLLKDLILFDRYIGDKIAEEEKSLGIGLVLQDTQQTLIDAQVTPLLDTIISTLEQQFDAKLRDA